MSASSSAHNPAAETGSAAAPGRLGLWFAAAVFLSLASSILFRATPIGGLSAGWRFAAALLPVPALVGIVLAARRTARRLDELEQRIQLEALATAFGVAGTAFLVFSQLQIAGMLGPEDWFIPWIAIWGGYVVGLAGARRRFQ